MPLNNQSRRSGMLGAGDPRTHRDAQSNLNDPANFADPIGVDDKGRVSMKQDGAKVGWFLKWLGDRWGAEAPKRPTTTKTAAYTARYGEFVRCDPSGGAFAVTLPASAAGGQDVVVKNTTTSANAITVTAFGQDLIDGASTYVLAASRASATFTAVPGGWDVT